MSAEDVTKRCYVCNAYFDDRVKLGMHITACYDEAVNVRKELWHPHPLDLVDQQHYTAYMAKKHHYTIDQLKDARKKGVSFVTADNFSDMKSNLRGGGSAQRGPQQGGGTGVTYLKEELSDEISKLRDLRRAEEQKMNEREERFMELCDSIEAKKGPRAVQQPLPGARAYDGNTAQVPVPRMGGPAHNSGVSVGLTNRPPSPGSSRMVGANGRTFSPITGSVPEDRGAPKPVSAVPPPVVATAKGTTEKATVRAPRIMEDGRIECPICRKLFGRKGYEAHSKRCGLDAQDDFTFSQDARKQAEMRGRLKVTEDPVQGGQRSDQFTEFMTTYPRPVLDEGPKSAQHRSKNAEEKKRMAEYNQMVQREMSRPYAGGRPN